MAAKESRWGVILDARKAVPIYHRIVGTKFNGSYWAPKSACGRWIESDRYLQLRHLKMFAKKCKGCYPR
jgi:hypothetical protein